MALVKNPKIIYISGPYRDPSRANVVHNITRAWELAHKIWDIGHIAICPHTNTLLMSDPQNGDTFIAGDLHIIRRCVDALLMAEDWGISKGARAERDFAIAHKIPVFNCLSNLLSWLRGEEKESPVHPESSLDNSPESQHKENFDDANHYVCGPPAPPDPILEGLNKAKDRLAETISYLTKGPSKLETFPGGAKRSSDKGRGRYDLISPLFLKRLAHQLELGAVHPDIGARNWEKGIGTSGGIPLERFQNSRARHLAQADAGETDEDHLAAAAFNLMCETHIDELTRQGRKCLSSGCSSLAEPQSPYCAPCWGASEADDRTEKPRECIEEGCNNSTINVRCASCWSLFNAEY